jgi:hypothetical protein
MKRTLILLLLTALVLTAICALLPAQQKKRKAAGQKQSDSVESPPADNAALPDLAGVLAAEAVSDKEKQSDYPAIAYAADGSLWMVWVEWNDKDADRVMARRRSPQGAWSEPVQVSQGWGDHYLPAAAALNHGVLVVWSAQVNGNFDLYSAAISDPGRVSRPERITSAAYSDFNVRAASDKTGNVTIVWQSFRHGNADVFARRYSAGKWGREVQVSASKASDWEPAVALDSKGRAWISWDSYDRGNYDVMLRSFDGAALGQPVTITTEAAAQFHTSVAVDHQDRVWVAWDEAGPNWGKDYSSSSAAPGSEGLHARRSLGIRVYANGRVHEPAASLSPVLTRRMKQFAELPHLAVDGSGAMTLVFRHWTYTRPNEIYHFYAARLSGGQWSLPWQFGSSSGHNSQRASLALDPAGNIEAAYSSDGRSTTVLPTSQAHAMHYVAYLAKLPKAGEPVSTGLSPVSLPAPGQAAQRRPRHSMAVAGKTYKLMLGDCHRHTDIRGHSGVDGSVLDTYRYAIDAAQLDYLGTSDHNEVTGGNWPDGLRDYQWYWVQKAVDLMTHPPVFTGIYSYEHSMASPGGHRHVLFLRRGAPLRMIDRGKGPQAADNLPPAMWKFWEENVFTQPGQKSVIVPHTFAAGPLADWNWPNARFDCLLEIYQGARGSYEAWRTPEGEKRGGTQTDRPGHFAQDALAKGNIYGFVSFSDHRSTHNSWAAVWTEHENREGILDGMYARRTYAGTDEMILRVQAGSHLPGEEWSAPLARPIRIEASIDAPDTILRIDVVKDGKYVYTVRPNARTAKLSWQDTEAKAGKSYYYVRVFQRDTEKPEGDPEIGWVSPFYVTYTAE